MNQMNALPIEPRFNSNWMPEPNTGCWLWTGARDGCKIKRPRISVKGKNAVASRVSWTLHRGPIPPGLLVCHKCDTPMCVNPDHLFLGTYADNNADRERKGRSVYLKGEKHANTTLRETDVLAIRAEYVPSKKRNMYDALARKFHVSRATVALIIKRKNWTHI